MKVKSLFLLLVITIIFIFFSIPASEAQISLYDLPRFRSSVGVAFDQRLSNDLFNNICGDLRFNIRTFRASLDYGYSEDIKVSLIPGVSFTDVRLVDVPPSPSCEVRLTNMGALGTTNLDYFVIGSFGADYSQFHAACGVLHLVNMQLRGGVGLSHTLQTQGSWVLKPYFGSFYSNIWKNISTTNAILIDRTSGLFTGEAGIEVELTPTISAVGTWVFSFESSDAHFRIGLNFH